MIYQGVGALTTIHTTECTIHSLHSQSSEIHHYHGTGLPEVGDQNDAACLLRLVLATTDGR